METSDVILSVKDLQKRIGGRTLIQDISFDVKKGEVFGFLGPNGAGKTTTIRMLVGLIKPTRGTIHICGYDLQKDFVKAMGYVGCIVENPELYKFLTGRENLQQFARMAEGISDDRIEEVVRLVGLENRIDDKVKTYSLGMRQRLGIAQALLARPKLLILDEPTNGLDPGGIRELREFVRMLAEQEGLSVFISSHLLSEIEMMCDSVAIIHQGRCLYSGSVQGLLKREKGDTLWRVNPVQKALKMILAQPFVQTATIEGDSIRCTVPPDLIPELNARLVEGQIEIYSIRQAVPTLEDLFLEMTGGDRIA
ncbi:ABC transporter ATP-binding protein [Effusibacillus lacus]|uniref:ABC transporter ATP-binding protein n=1 Tax=Effusibacillus lacus TaxID=1348429 RepID=A0A292YNX9_9BACL|nr:ABC transporter ATP-binding protein [Effusibacillus lacus]TCS70621.1 ABC-2 type transport system ATP-binding protein [Effusibacillus lacus]GAX90619.1 ABC transporter ATP-binding protein [Effusibacillus lacus]